MGETPRDADETNGIKIAALPELLKLKAPRASNPEILTRLMAFKATLSDRV